MMRILRGLGGAVLWLLACVVGLVAVILCVTVLLLPAGIPLLRVARRMFAKAARLMLPRALAHPVQTAKDSVSEKVDSVKGASNSASSRGAISRSTRHGDTGA